MKLKISLTILLFLLAILLFNKPTVMAGELNLDAKGYVAMDALSGKVLLENNAHERWYPASMTKVMTLLLAFEALDKGEVSMEDPVVTSHEAAGYGGSQVWLEPGEEFTLKEMLLGIAVGSANDCSVAVAEHLAGSHEEFVKLMNARAAEIGCTKTHFMNSHGLHHENHYTTPYDMALMSREALKHPGLIELTTVKEYTFREEPLLHLYNTNKLLWWYPGTTGLKTGFTPEANRNLAATAIKEDFEVIVVVMNVEDKQGHFRESMKLLNWAFANFSFHKLYDEKERVLQIRVGKGAHELVDLFPQTKVGAAISKGEEDSISVEFIHPSIINAPLLANTKVGEVVVRKDSKEVSRVDLLSKQDIPRASFWQYFWRVCLAVFLIGTE